MIEREARGLLLDAWAQDYRFSSHDIWPGHFSGNGIELARAVGGHLDSQGIHHAFTGLAAAWALDQFAGFRLTTAYVDGDLREVAEGVGVRETARGANVQMVGPNGRGRLRGGRVRRPPLRRSGTGISGHAAFEGSWPSAPSGAPALARLRPI